MNEAEIAKQFGFEDGVAPFLRREVAKDVPAMGQGVSVPFEKAKLLIDRLLTVRFWEFIPDAIEVDQSENSEVFSKGETWALCVRTDIPPPILEKDQNWSGVYHNKHPKARELENYFRMLALDMLNNCWRLGCYRIAPPFIYKVDGDPSNPLAPPYIGVVTKYLRKRQDGRIATDMEAQAAVLVPPGTEANPENRVGAGTALVVPNNDNRLTEIVNHPQNLFTPKERE